MNKHIKGKRNDSVSSNHGEDFATNSVKARELLPKK